MNEEESKLLNLAAQAAGFNIGNEVGEYGWWSGQSGWVFARRNANGTSTPWNPLIDDGDALRLAVLLNLSIVIDADIGVAQIGRWDFKADVREEMNGDTLSATRRAIVRAAAEIGKGVVTPNTEVSGLPRREPNGD